MESSSPTYFLCRAGIVVFLEKRFCLTQGSRSRFSLCSLLVSESGCNFQHPLMCRGAEIGLAPFNFTAIVVVVVVTVSVWC